MAGVSVRLMPTKGDAITENGYTNTDDRGIFRISTAPGNYYLQAAPNSSVSGNQAIQEIVNEGEAEPTYSETFYPEASSKDEASVLELVAGRELPDVDVRLIHSEPHKITGMISGAPSNSAGLSVTVASHDQASTTGLIQKEHGDTKFQLGPITPGTYHVYAQCVAGNHELRSQVVEVKLADADVDLNLILARGSDLAGKVEVVGLSPATAASFGGYVTLQNYDLAGAMPAAASIGRDRSFQIRDVHPAKYSVSIAPLPENGFVQSVAVNGTAVPNNIIDLTAGVEGSTIVITINPNGASISGRVQGQDDSHLPVPAYVVLRREGMDTPDAWRSSAVGADNAYAFKALPPGKYKLFAVDMGTGMMAREDILRMYETLATDVVELKEGDRVSKDIKLLVAKEP